jgi:hypothetical protein
MLVILVNTYWLYMIVFYLSSTLLRPIYGNDDTSTYMGRENDWKIYSVYCLGQDLARFFSHRSLQHLLENTNDNSLSINGRPIKWKLVQNKEDI